MALPLSQALHLLQQISLLQVRRDVELVFAPAGGATQVEGVFELHIKACKDALRGLCRCSTNAELAGLCLERALFLRMLVSSATARLAAWKSQAEWQPLRRSQLRESLGHDAEQHELAWLEKAMTPHQFANYACRRAQRAA